jgi:hypothetical protein
MTVTVRQGRHPVKKIGVAVLAMGAFALLSVSGCDRVGHRNNARADRGDIAGRMADKAERQASRAGGRYGDAGAGGARVAQAPTYKDGKPIWAANRRRSAEENIARMFQRNGSDVGAATSEDYVAKAHAFLAAPPRGVQTANRFNGDKLYYDAKTNLFVVATRDGALRIMMKPRDGASYWKDQLANLDRRGGYGQGARNRRAAAGGGSERAGANTDADDNG